MRDTIQRDISVAEAHLRRARAALCDEISGYPTPISGCDAQFNHLLALRTQVGSALAALDDLPFVPTPRMPTPATRLESR